MSSTFSENYIRTISKNLGSSQDVQSICTIPAGNTFICFKKVVTGGTGTVTIIDSDGPLSIVNAGQSEVLKEEFIAGATISARQSGSGCTVSLVGIMFNDAMAPVSAGEEGGEGEGSSSSESAEPSGNVVTKITITSSGSSADGEWTLNTSTGSYEKGVLRLECVQDALYAWQIWDREMPEYPDLYYSTGYTFQTNNVSEVLGTREWHDVRFDDPITLTLTAVNGD